MLTFEAGKRYVTRGGERGLLLSNCFPGEFPLMFLPDGRTGSTPMSSFVYHKRADGTALTERVHDLIAEEGKEPEPVYWSKPEHVPGPVCWVRNREHHVGYSYMITEVSPNGLCFGGTEEATRFTDIDQFEYSTDRINWKPCTVAP